jgi:predicted dehydrogenase
MTLRAILAGPGQWARRALVPGLRAIPDLELVAMVGASLAEAERFAAEHAVPRAFGSLEAACAAVAPDLAVIATPDDLHPRQSALALAAGAAVYCEKPLANDAAAAHRLAALAAQRRRPGTVGYAFRYSPAIQALRADLRAGRLGEPWLIELFERNPQFHPRAGRPITWKGDPAHARAGALFEYGSHAVDLALWLIGPIRRVSASLTRVLPGARLDDIATLQLQFAPPTLGILVASWVLPGGLPGIRIRVQGAEGSGEVRLGDRPSGGESYHRLAWDGGEPEAVPLAPGGDPLTGSAGRQLADFAARLRGQPSPYEDTLPSLADGARVQDVLDAALAATERWVEIADPIESTEDGGDRHGQ